MDFDEVDRLYKELAQAPAGVALRLGVNGNTPDDIAIRWQRWNALSDYEAILLRQSRENGVGRIDERIFGLPAVGAAYGDLDRLQSSAVLVWQLEEHLNARDEEVSQEVLERVVADAIDDARNPDRRGRVPARGEAERWWKNQSAFYQNPEESRPTGMDLVEADEAVLVLRKRIVDALVHGQAMAQNPRMRAEAERYIKQQVAKADVHVEFAARKYQSAAREFRELKEREDTPDSAKELLEANEHVASSRAAALIAYSAALHLASQRTAPFMACTRRSLSERFPHEYREILATKAGRLTEATSVEAALRLTPKDPANWYPEKDGMLKQIHRYVDASLDRDRLDWKEMADRRHLPRTPTLRGQAMAMACFDVISRKQKELSDRWGRLSSFDRSIVEDGQGVNSHGAHEYSRMIGVPSMPALTLTDQARDPHEGLALQKSMVEKASDPVGMYSVPPPTVSVGTETAFEAEEVIEYG